MENDAAADTANDEPDRLQQLLDLTPAGRDRWLAPSTPMDGPPRLFGGQVASQSLRAATLTVPDDRTVHSLHAYFILGGRPGVTLQLDVDHTRDGRSFTTRRVTASQDGEAIFVLQASFHVDEPGTDWQLPAPTDIPDPDELPEPVGMPRFGMLNPIEVRPAQTPQPGAFPMSHPFWVRARRRLPDDPALHACVIAFMSDMGAVNAARAPGVVTQWGPGSMAASLDHAVWFHRPARADEWLLFHAEPVSNHGSRGLARGGFFDRQGVLVASLAQEALLRSGRR